MKNKDNFGIFDQMIVTKGKTKKMVKLRPIDWICYSNNKEFIGALSASWVKLHESLGLPEVITTDVLFEYLNIYHIRTNQGKIYVPFSSRTTNLLKATYNYYERCIQEEKEKLEKYALFKKPVRSIFRQTGKSTMMLQNIFAITTIAYRIKRFAFIKAAIKHTQVNLMGRRIIHDTSN